MPSRARRRICFFVSQFYASASRSVLPPLLSRSPIPTGWAKPSRQRLTIFFRYSMAQGDFIAVRAHRDGTNDLPEFSIVLEDTQSARAIHATCAKRKALRSISS